MIRLGVHCKSVAAKSSTMKGAKALASKYDQRRCRTAKENERRVREELLCSAPGNLRSIDRWKLRQGGSLGRALVFWAVTSPSDVTGCATFVTNRGRSRDAGGGSSVPGGEKTRVFSPINRVIQIPETGRVSSVKAAEAGGHIARQ